MNTKDYILLSLGIGTSDDIMDRILKILMLNLAKQKSMILLEIMFPAWATWEMLL